MNNMIIIGRNEPPKYYGYWRYANGGFSSVTRCQICGNVGLYEDCHIVNPCKHCGGKVVNFGAGKWIPPKTILKGWFIFKYPVVIEEGYWLINDCKAK